MSILMMLIPVISGAIGTLLFEQWQKLWTWSASWPAVIKQIVVAVLSGVLAKAVGAGVVLAGVDPTALGNQDFVALASAGLAYVFHLGATVKAAAAPAAKVAGK